MAPAVCVSSFRMLIRRTDLGHHWSRNLCLRPATLTVNSWYIRRQGYCTPYKDSTPISGETNTEKASASKTTTTTSSSSSTTTTPSPPPPPSTISPSSTLHSNAVGDVKMLGKDTKMPQANVLAKTQDLYKNSIDNLYLKSIDLTHMTVTQLKTELRSNGLSSTGKKQLLIERLQNYLKHKENKIEENDIDLQKQQQKQKNHQLHLTINVNENFHRLSKMNMKSAENEKQLSSSSSSSSSSTTSSSDLVNELKLPLLEIQGRAIKAANPITINNHRRVNAATVSDTDLLHKRNLNFYDDNNNNDDNHNNNNNNNNDDDDDNGSGSGHGSRVNFIEIEKNCTITGDDTTITTKRMSSIRNDGDVFVEYIQGLPHITVPLPSRNEKCRFALKSVTHNVGDLLEMLKTEDRGIDRATILNHCGIRVASTSSIESLLDEQFWLVINAQKYKVVPPARAQAVPGDSDRLGDVRCLVAQLYEALNVGEYHKQKELDMTKKLEDLKFEIAPLEKKKSELCAFAERKTNIMAWVGLGLMAVQFGVLARLTWWEYSWDIMEPVTYFVTYGTAMAAFAYYCINKIEYNYPEIKDREYLLSVHKRAKKNKFDIEEYNVLRRQIADIEFDLRRLRDPLNLQLPPHVDRAQKHLTIKPTQFYQDISPTIQTTTKGSTTIEKHAE